MSRPAILGAIPPNGTVCHGAGEWAGDDDADGIREVHRNTCEGAGAARRTYLRVFRGVHKANLHLYVATYEALLNTKQVTASLIRRMCFGELSAHANYTEPIKLMKHSSIYTIGIV
jgi:hypothetical protein